MRHRGSAGTRFSECWDCLICSKSEVRFFFKWLFGMILRVFLADKDLVGNVGLKCPMMTQ